MVTRLSAEMLVDLPLIREARVSPDGHYVVAAVSPASKRDEHPVSTLWLARTNSSAPETQLTAGTANDTCPRWSPDSDQIAFLSDRAKRGTSQVYVLPLSGGEALPKTDERSGVSDLCWLPGDARKIAYLAIDARDDETARQRDEERKDANVYGEFWPYARVKVLDLDTSEHRAYDIGDRHVVSLAPSHDGKRLALGTWPTPDIDHSMSNFQIIVLSLEDGIYEEVGEPGQHMDSINWAADGSALYYIAGAGETAVSSSQLWRIDLQPASNPVCLTPELPACVSDLAVCPATGSIHVLVASGTESDLCRFESESGALRATHSFSGALRSLSASNGTIAFVGDTPGRPGDVMVANDGNVPHYVTSLHEWLDPVTLGEQEIVQWTRDGLSLDGILIWPEGKSRYDGPMPAIVSLHGGPYGRWTNSFIAGYFGRWLAAKGYLVFLPNPRGGMGHGQAFAESVLYTVGDEDYLDIMAGVDMLIEEGIADPDRLGCGGWSQGGFMTAWAVGHTDRFKAAVMGAGVSDWGMMIATSDIPSYENLMGGGNPYESTGPHSFDRQSPISYVHNASTPTLIVHGENDLRVPVSQGIFFHRGLRAYGVPAELVTYPREPHGIQERNHQLDLLERVAAWYRRWIPIDDGQETQP